MKLLDLAFRSMKKNIKLYYLYFFTSIFGSALYFIFSNLQYSSHTFRYVGKDFDLAFLFEIPSILLFLIISLFTLYANYIFLKRRSREMGLYQLVGLAKTNIAKLLIIENILLSTGALLLGLSSGMLLSRIFLSILAKIIDQQKFLTIQFSSTAFLQTLSVFALLIFITSLQIILIVYRSTLLDLFNADKKEESPRNPRNISSGLFTLLSFSLIGYSYWLMSGNIAVNQFLIINIVAMFIFPILGTYLLFRVAINWIFYQFRKRKNGYLDVKNSLLIAPLMHRIRTSATSLTIITLFSALTMVLLAASYSYYYNSEQTVRLSTPNDFLFSNDQENAKRFSAELNKANINFMYKSFKGLQVKAKATDKGTTLSNGHTDSNVLFFTPESFELKNFTSQHGEAVVYDLFLSGENVLDGLPTGIKIKGNQQDIRIKIDKIIPRNLLNFYASGLQVIASKETIEDVKKSVQRYQDTYIDTFQILNHRDLAAASSIYKKYVNEQTYYTKDCYQRIIQTVELSGIVFFIIGFLSFNFLVSVGSVLYLKQMTEAEQDRKNYITLRQIGFDIPSIMSGIIRRQVFVFGVPLVIGLLHSIFIIKVIKDAFPASIFMPSVLAIIMYVFIYLIFAFLTIRYYKKMVREAL